MMKKEGKRIRQNLEKNPHEPSAAEAMILLMGETIRKLNKEEKIRGLKFDSIVTDEVRKIVMDEVRRIKL